VVGNREDNRQKEHTVSVNTVTHLNFRGDAQAALTFYQSVFGGDLAVVTYKDAGNVQEPSEADQVMWGQVSSADGFRIMAYDVPSRLPNRRGENAFFVSVRGATAEEITAYWEKLSEGASVVQPLAPAQWAPLYGMLTDRFGVTWVIDVVSPYDAS
jgi:PhnB protein